MSEGHNSLTQAEAKKKSAGYLDELVLTSKAKHDDVTDSSSTKDPSREENEDAPPLVGVPLPTQSGTLLTHGNADLEWQESSSNPPPEPAWGKYEQTITAATDWGTQNHPTTPPITYHSGTCRYCDSPMAGLLKTQLLTCHRCKQANQLQDQIDGTANPQQDADDEQEYKFTRIHMAGEHESDYDDAWDNESDESDQEETEDEPKHKPTIHQCMNAIVEHVYKHVMLSLPVSINTTASDDLTFRLGSITDGIVRTHSLSPIPLTPNYYHPLTLLDEHKSTIHQCMNAIVEPVYEPKTPDLTPTRQIRPQRPSPSPFQPLVIPGTPDNPSPQPYDQRATWPQTRNEEFYRILHHGAASMVSNSQRLAHPSKVQRNVRNQQIREQLHTEIERQMKYIDSRTQTDPTPYSCSTHDHPSTLANTSTRSFRPTISKRSEMGELHAPPHPNMVKHGVLNPKPHRESSYNYETEMLSTYRGYCYCQNNGPNMQCYDMSCVKLQRTAENKKKKRNSESRIRDNSEQEHDQHEELSKVSLSVYYQVFDRHRPEMGESSAESVDRMNRINDEFLHKMKKRKVAVTNNTQEVTLISEYRLYDNLDKHISDQPIELLFDTGASLNMISAMPHWAWTNLRECMYNVSGCFLGSSYPNLQMGEYHGIVTLDSGETVRMIIPEAVQLPTELSRSNLLANTAYLMAGHAYISDLYKPKLKFKGGGQYTMEVKKGHLIIQMLPFSPHKKTTHRTIYIHDNQPYDPPTFVNDIRYQHVNRANLQTPTAFIWHLRYACKSADVLKHTQQHVEGLTTQMGSWKQLKQLLPCSACIAAKMRKTKITPTSNYTDVTNCAMSWTPGEDNKTSTTNEIVSLDWAIINKKNKPKVNNLFAIYLGNSTGLVFQYPAESKGQAAPSLLAYIRRCGTPKTILHDNAAEFCGGEFAQICKEKGIQQTEIPPYDHNKNPRERYIEIITSMTRALLFISGLKPDEYWEHALEHSVGTQNRTALPGRCTPYELTFGKRPNVNNLRIFGCEALAYIEKEKRTKLDMKAEKTTYLGMSPTHSDDTAKLLSLKTRKVIFRRNVYYNERSFPERKRTTHNTEMIDTGEDLIGEQFYDEGS